MKMIFSLLNELGILVKKSVAHVFWSLFLDSVSCCPLTHLSVLLPGPRCLNYCGFVLSLVV